MSFAAGALSKTLVAATTAQLASAVATGGTGPYTYQWYKSLTTGFSPGAGNIIAGATALTLNDSGNTPGLTYFYVVVATDTGNANVTVNSAQLSVAMEPSQQPNQFTQNNMVGIVDMRVGPTNIISAIVDASATAPIQPGQGVKVVSSTVGGPPKVVAISGKADPSIGFAIFNMKDVQYPIGTVLEVALWGTIIWCYATAAISSFAEVCLDPTYVGGVQPTGNTATLMGTAIDGCSGPGLIRVQLVPNPAYASA